jgi:hypothetical protein
VPLKNPIERAKGYVQKKCKRIKKRAKAKLI